MESKKEGIFLKNKHKEYLLPPLGMNFNMGPARFCVGFRNVGKMRFSEDKVPSIIDPGKDARMPERIMILPPSWQDAPASGAIQACYQRSDGLVVIVTEQRHTDVWWRHVSCSYADKLPSWRDLREVKALFLGDGRSAIQVFPISAEYANVHPYVLHLWCNLDDADFLPDFRIMGNI